MSHVRSIKMYIFGIWNPDVENYQLVYTYMGRIGEGGGGPPVGF